MASYDQGTVCFVTGTLIRTPRGDVAVENLSEGDLIVTRDGRMKPIRWIGHRHTRCDRHPEPRRVWPVRVAAGTFGNGLPYADLWLSPGHALCLDDALVPVRALLDGDRIAQVEVGEVTYWHVELDGHDVLLANGLPAESYLDTGNRRGFDNADAPLLHFDECPGPGYDGAGYCLPMIESGPRLSAIRARYGLGTSHDDRSSASAAPIGLVADGTALVPFSVQEGAVCFAVPAGCADLRLVSPSFDPPGDRRRLGVLVGELAVSDGAGWEALPLDSPGLYAGFHALERNGDGAWRWTDGEGHLAPVRLWGARSGSVLLRVSGIFADFGSSAAASEVGDAVGDRAAAA